MYIYIYIYRCPLKTVIWPAQRLMFSRCLFLCVRSKRSFQEQKEQKHHQEHPES